MAGFIPKNGDISEFYYHGIGHPLGLDTHDLRPEGDLVLAPGMVMTVEPGIYIPEEGFAIRLENDVLVTKDGPVDMMAHIPLEADEIEALMNR